MRKPDTIWKQIELEHMQFIRQQLNKHYAVLYQALVDRDGEECSNCESTINLTIHHVVQVANGGTNQFDNLKLLCSACNFQDQSMSKEGRSCILCGKQAFLKFNAQWFCESHWLEVTEMVKSKNIGRRQAYKLMLNKYDH